MTFALRAGDATKLALFGQAVGITASLEVLERTAVWMLARFALAPWAENETEVATFERFRYEERYNCFSASSGVRNQPNDEEWMANDWYKNAIIYALDVETFQDSNGDGVGDFKGLTARLGYLADLGINCLWLLPFYPSPGRDDGYDVADYYSVDPRLGTLDDFRACLREAERLGLKVLIDLVVNHTSTDHPWFKAARSDRASPFRDYYIWLDELPAEERRGGLVFPGEEVSNWAYDEVSDSYYWHWFYHHQPDLNTGNPEVREEIKKIIGFWLDLGVSGFRMDAAPFLFKRKGLEGSFPDDPVRFLLELRTFLNEQRPDAIFLAEADVNTDELSFFLGEGERMHLLFNFVLNNYFFLSLAEENAGPLAAALESLPARPASFQWANFARNHDELNLDRLSLEDRTAVFNRFAPDPDSRIYGRGIRRRLSPMLDGMRRHIELVYSLLFSLPGTPVLRYGQEIGMGDDLTLPGRMSVRTPMQWSSGPNGGFSSAPSESLVRAPVTAGDFGYARINVESQLEDPDSMLSFMRQLIRNRTHRSELGHGDLAILDVGDSRVFAHTCETPEGVTVALHNLSRDAAVVQLDLSTLAPASLVDVLGDRFYDPLEGGLVEFHIDGYGYRWLHARRKTGEQDEPQG